MPGRCCVPGCNNEIGGHQIPSDLKMKEKWRVRIKRVDSITKKLWNFGSRDVVCPAHFLPTDYLPPGLMGQRKRLKRGAVPSVFPFSKQPSASSIDRAMRKQSRDIITMELTKVLEDTPTESQLDSVNHCDVANEVTVTTEPEQLSIEQQLKTPDCSNVTVATQCTLCTCSVQGMAHAPAPKKSGFKIEDLKDKPDMISYYTGFSSFDHFMYLYILLGPSTTQLSYQCSLVSPVNQLFMTLIKLRQAKDDIELAFMFDVSKSTVGKIVTTWINFMYFELKEISIWPSKEVIQETMPKKFGEQFPHTRVILDATEIPIAKPSNVDLQSATFSTYKNRNTAKTLIGISPAGMVTFISDTYGGAATDRQIVERSALCNSSMFCAGDSIMADRGIMVQDLFAAKDVYVNTPCLLRGKTQLDANDVIRDRRIASKRIHVERVIGLAKTYKILKREIPSGKRDFVGKIIFVCFMLTNFREPIVGEMA